MTKTEINSELNEIKDKKDFSIVFDQDFNNPSDWKCRLFGIDNFFFVPKKGKEPNIFWRTVQYLLIGNKWSKTDVDGWKHAKYLEWNKTYSTNRKIIHKMALMAHNILKEKNYEN